MDNIINKFENIKKENKLFIIFLIVHFLVWVSVGLVRVVLPADSLEGIWWGSLLDFGSPKHPPLAAWITYFAYLPFKSNVSIYVLSQLFVVGGFIYTYRLAKNFLDSNKSMLSVIVLEGCWIYSYVTGYYGFNPDVVLMLTLPMITFYFYECMKNNKGSDWLKLGFVVGLSLLNKYQTILLVAGMAIWAGIFNPKTYKNKFFYLSVLVAWLIFMPHILWLIKYDFFPFLYYDRELNLINGYNHITSPLMFLGMQVVCIIGTLVIYSLFRLITKQKPEFIKEYNKKEFWFLIILTFAPCVIHTLIGLYYGSDVRPRWGYVFWYMLGIILFYSFPCKTEEKEFKVVLKLSYIVMFIIFIVMGTMLTVEKNYRSRYPVDNIWNDMSTLWNRKYNTQLKYVGGDSEWSFPLTIYAKNHPINIMDTFGYKNPWIDEEDLKKNGAVFIDRNQFLIEDEVRKGCPYISKEIEIVPVEYKFTVHNALKMPREYTIYYYMVAPQD